MSRTFHLPMDFRERRFAKLKIDDKRVFCVKSEMLFRVTLLPEVALFIDQASSSNTMLRTLVDHADMCPMDMYKFNFFDCGESEDFSRGMESFLKRLENFELGVQLENVFRTAVSYVKACWTKPPYAFICPMDSDREDEYLNEYIEIKFAILHRIVALAMSKISEFIFNSKKSKLSKEQKLFMENSFFINGMMDAALRHLNAYPERTRSVMLFSKAEFMDSCISLKKIEKLTKKIRDLKFKAGKIESLDLWFSLFIKDYFNHLEHIHFSKFYEYDPIDLGAYIISPSAEVINSNVYTELSRVIPFFIANKDFKKLEANVFYGCGTLDSPEGALRYCLEFDEAVKEDHWSANDEYEYASFGTILYDSELPSHIYLSQKGKSEVLCVTSYNGRYYADFFKLSKERKATLKLKPVLF